jgi:hypothetical protein
VSPRNIYALCSAFNPHINTKRQLEVYERTVVGQVVPTVTFRTAHLSGGSMTVRDFRERIRRQKPLGHLTTADRVRDSFNEPAIGVAVTKAVGG